MTHVSGINVRLQERMHKEGARSPPGHRARAKDRD
jgi:hypothetical protein